MIILETFVVVVSIATMHTVEKIVRQVLNDEHFDTHVFENLAFSRKLPSEQSTIVHNFTYFISIVLLLVLWLLLPFHKFEYYTWFNLFSFLQLFLIFSYPNLTRLEKNISLFICMLYYFTSSCHIDNLIIFSVLQIEPVLQIDILLFGEKAYLRKYVWLHRIDLFLFFLFWFFCLISFCYHQIWVDCVTIPLSFYFQIIQERCSDYKKKV